MVRIRLVSLRIPLSVAGQPATKGDQRYYSNIVISGRKENPLCMWIDANHDLPITAFQVHFPEFVFKVGGFEHDKD